MKAVVCQNQQLRVADRPEPKPGKGHVLVQVLRCGICGSDLHARQHCDHLGGLMLRSGFKNPMRSSQEIVFGHEFSAEILEYGPKCSRKLPVGTRVCAVPLIRREKEIDLIGLCEEAPGAYAERMLVQESLIVAVPNGLDAERAALTEPMAVGLHAVHRGEVKKSDTAIVIGCGPVGLAVILMLRTLGVRKIVASDFSPARRELARRCGASVVVDPRENSPYTASKKSGFITDAPGMLELGVGTREKLGMLPVAWHRSWRLAEALGAAPKRPIIFECVGVPGMLQSVIDGAPLFSRVVVVGVCMQSDQIEPALAINKEIDLRFVIGYTPLEYRDTLHMIAEGKVDPLPLVTGTVGLGGVDDAFTALARPEKHVKVLIDPGSGVKVA
ncbi:alcohol dehydrogenase [Solimonas sp. K1W22B-7]|uniref:zinc-binding dehydrogenase n=1 Tax=Solimonas sp. K1W22B-7 TaxID=2303331 RepID=UPI000E32F035|nr:zinc-binding dehydrogenase [Solimonas sp. K1W22B-7]AXQ30072.1 alcohol dehydrogenase [Solimonas sp. K1W22B-7]